MRQGLSLPRTRGNNHKMSNNKKIVSLVVLVLVVLGAFALFHKAPVAPVADQQNAGMTQNTVDEYPNGLKLGDATEKWVALPLAAGQNQAFFTNRTGHTMILDYAEALTDGIASSSFKIFVATTTATAASTTFDFSQPYSSMITGDVLSTSSPALSLITSGGATTTTRKSAIAVADGQSVVLGMIQTYGVGCTGSVCEAATSTNRGFNVKGKVHFHSTLGFF